MKITDEAVDAASEFLPMNYSDNPFYRAQLRAALEAAAPHLLESNPDVNSRYLAKHTKTDPVCIHYKEIGPFRRYLNKRGRGKACLICVPLYKPRTNK